MNKKYRDLVTLVIQLAAVVAALWLALVDGEYYALLGLAALAGGSNGSLAGEMLALVAKGVKGAGTKCILFLALVVVSAGCAGVDKQLLFDSRSAIGEIAGTYFSGCKDLTVAPAFGVDWSKPDAQFSGGILAGCIEMGRLLEFRCTYLKDTKKLACEDLHLWQREPQYVSPYDHDPQIEEEGGIEGYVDVVP